MKKILSIILLVVFMVMTVPIGAMAANDTDNAPSAYLIDKISKVFQGVDSFEMLDSNHNNITQYFISTYYYLYASGDFVSLRDIMAENDYTLTYGDVTAERNAVQSRGVNSTAVTDYSDWYVRLIALDELWQGKRVELAYRVKGTYYCDTNGNITSADIPTFEYSTSDIGDYFDYTFYNINRTRAISSDQSSVTFNLSFSMRFSYPYSEAMYADRGPFSGSFTSSVNN